MDDKTARKMDIPQARSGGGLWSILDLSSTLQDVYQGVLKNGDATLGELVADFPGLEREELKVYLDLLSRLEYLEKYAGEAREIRFRVKGRARAQSTLPDDLWSKLEN